MVNRPITLDRAHGPEGDAAKEGQYECGEREFHGGRQERSNRFQDRDTLRSRKSPIASQ